MPVTPNDMRRGPDRTAPPPLVVAAALTAVEAFVLAGLLHPASTRVLEDDPR